MHGTHTTHMYRINSRRMSIIFPAAQVQLHQTKTLVTVLCPESISGGHIISRSIPGDTKRGGGGTTNKMVQCVLKPTSSVYSYKEPIHCCPVSGMYNKKTSREKRRLRYLYYRGIQQYSKKTSSETRAVKNEAGCEIYRLGGKIMVIFVIGCH